MARLDATVGATAAAQHGLITDDQAVAAGLSRKMICARVRSGLWIVVHLGVYRMAPAPRTWEQHAMAACLWAGPDAVVSHRSAAHLWRLDGFGPPGRIEVTVPRPNRRWGAPVTVHQTKAWDLIGRTTRFGVPVTGIARTILDVCAGSMRDVVPPLRALDESRRRGLVTWPELWETLVRHACRGRNGIRMFRRILATRHRRTPPGGEFARLFLLLLEEAGLPEPECEHPIVADGHKYFVDLAFVAVKVAIELDGRGHDSEKSLEEDPARENRIKLEGWLVLRYTWKRFINEPLAIVAEIRAALASCPAVLAQQRDL